MRRVAKDPVLDIETGKWTADEYFDWDGKVELCGGPSAAATANEQAQTNFYNQMTQEQTSAFSQQQDILKAIQAVSLPILQGGPNAYGFTPQEDALLKGEITTGASQAEANAVNAQALQQQQRSGGAAPLPGEQEELSLNAKILGEQNKANQLTSETLEGYKAGQSRYSQALSALTGNASLLNPTSYATETAAAGSAATGAVNLADSERSNLLSSILGGVIGAGTSLISGGGLKGAATGFNTGFKS